MSLLEFDKLVQSIDSEIKNEPQGHSEFQIRNFIIGSQPTDYGKYKQCILELRSRIKNYKTIKDKYNLLKSKDSLLVEEIKQLSECEILLEDLKRETYIINDLFEEIKNNIDLSKREELEIEYWDEKFGQEAAACKIAGYPLPVNLIQNILSLPIECKTKQLLIKNINNIKELTNVSERNITNRSR